MIDFNKLMQGFDMRRIAVICLLFAAAQAAPAADSASDLWKKAEAARAKGDTSAALQLYEQYLARKPDDAARRAFTGWFLIERMSRWKDGLAYLEAAEKAGYRNAFIPPSRARAYRELHLHEPAAAAYLVAAADPGNGNPQRALFTFEAGRMYYEAGQFERALPLLTDGYRRSAAPNEKYAAAHYGRMLYDLFSSAFSQERWDDALKLLDLLEPFFSETKPDDTAQISAYHMLFYSVPLRTVVRELQSMKNPSSVQRVRVLGVYAFDASASSERFIADIGRAEKNMMLLIRHLSKGKLELVFERVYLPAAQNAAVLGASRTETEEWGDLDVVQPQETAARLMPLLQPVNGFASGGYDTVFFYFNGSKYRSARPNAGVVFKKNFKEPDHFPAERASMGLISIPYDTHRKLEGMYVHEYFHLLENRYGIKVKHGFSPDRHYKENKRAAFPEWKGSGQYDYFRWHFLTTFAPKGYALALHP